MKRTLRFISAILALIAVVLSLSGCFTIRISGPVGRMKKFAVIEKMNKGYFDVDKFMEFFLDSDFSISGFKSSSLRLNLLHVARNGDIYCEKLTGNTYTYYTMSDGSMYSVLYPALGAAPTSVNAGALDRLPTALDVFGIDMSLLVSSDKDDEETEEPLLTENMMILDDDGESITFSDAFFRQYADFVFDTFSFEEENREAFISGFKGSGGFADGVFKLEMSCENDPYKDFSFRISRGVDEKNVGFVNQYFRIVPAGMPESIGSVEIELKFYDIVGDGRGSVISASVEASRTISENKDNYVDKYITKIEGDFSLKDRDNPTFKVSYRNIVNENHMAHIMATLAQPEKGSKKNLTVRLLGDDAKYYDIQAELSFKTPFYTEFEEKYVNKLSEDIKNSSAHL